MKNSNTWVSSRKRPVLSKAALFHAACKSVWVWWTLFSLYSVFASSGLSCRITFVTLYTYALPHNPCPARSTRSAARVGLTTGKWERHPSLAVPSTATRFPSGRPHHLHWSGPANELKWRWSGIEERNFCLEDRQDCTAKFGCGT